MRTSLVEVRLVRMTLLLVVALTLVAVPGVFAGEDSGSDVFGVVVSSDGNAWPGVLISLTGGDVKQKTVADNEGTFRFTSIPPGDYVVVFQAPDKKKIKRKIPVATEDVDLGTIAID